MKKTKDSINKDRIFLGRFDLLLIFENSRPNPFKIWLTHLKKVQSPFPTLLNFSNFNFLFAEILTNSELECPIPGQFLEIKLNLEITVVF